MDFLFYYCESHPVDIRYGDIFSAVSMSPQVGETFPLSEPFMEQNKKVMHPMFCLNLDNVPLKEAPAAFKKTIQAFVKLELQGTVCAE